MGSGHWGVGHLAQNTHKTGLGAPSGGQKRRQQHQLPRKATSVLSNKEPGENIWTPQVSFRGILAPSEPNELYPTPFQPKI